MTKITEYFSTLNLTALPKGASDYINKQILNDEDIDLLEETDEDFVSVKELIQSDYPEALSKTPAPKKGAETTETPEVAEWKEAIETLNMLVEMGGEEKEVAEWKEAIETLNMLIE